MKAIRKTWPPTSVVDHIKQSIAPRLVGISVAIELELNVDFDAALAMTLDAYTDLVLESRNPDFSADFADEEAFLLAFEKRCRTPPR